MTEFHSFAGIIGQIALAQPDAVFDTLATAGGQVTRTDLEPTMLSPDGIEEKADRVRAALMDGGYVMTTQYPSGTTAITIGGDVTVVERTRRGDEAGRWRYVFEPRLEEFRATGRFGAIADPHSQETLDLLRSHGVLREFGLDPREADDPVYLAFLKERAAIEASRHQGIAKTD